MSSIEDPPHALQRGVFVGTGTCGSSTEPEPIYCEHANTKLPEGVSYNATF